MELLGQALSRDGTMLKLVRRGEECVILANGKSLMSSRMHGSEEALATLGLRRAQTMERPSVLVGGLGMGFTLRATLDLLPPEATVVVCGNSACGRGVESGPLGPLAGNPLEDTRVQVEIDDVAVCSVHGPADSMRCCWMWTMARPLLPTARTTTDFMTITGSLRRARLSRWMGCWRCGRREKIGNSNGGCAMAGLPWR